jgi:transcription elongation factor Elf1
MKTIEEILSANPNTYMWKDNETVDVTITSDKPFIDILYSYNCLSCESSIIKGNESIINNVSDTVNGINLTCKSCGQKHFIHKHIIF